MIGINRGFRAMIPDKKESTNEVVFGHRISFTIFDKEVRLMFQITSKGRRECPTKQSYSQKSP
jgi:hypothetical protein